MIKNIKKGFTLLELMIVVAIIGVLSTITVFAVSQARQNARDVKRKSDLEAIRVALEIFKSDCNSYPTTGQIPSTPGNSFSTLSTCAGGAQVVLQKWPDDPTTGNDYSYTRGGTGMTYTLCTALEDGSTSVSGCGSCGSGTCNYKVTNP